MPLLIEKEVLHLKLQTIPSTLLREIASSKKINQSSTPEVIKALIGSQISHIEIDEIIKANYQNIIKKRQALISDSQLLSELNLVSEFNWGVVQGQLDTKIQTNYVRKYAQYSKLIENVKSTLHNEVTSYVVCTWYNHWSTVLIEDFISQHRKVVPTLKNVKGVDIFFHCQPFDLKITYLPSRFPKNISQAIKAPKDLIIWLYENQGAQRFGSENRFFVVLYDEKNPSESWKIKRDISFIRSKIDNFFEKETVTIDDEISFEFNKETYSALSKILFIVK